MILSDEEIRRINREMRDDMRNRRVRVSNKCYIPRPKIRTVQNICSGRITIDDLAVDGGAKNTQDGWIPGYNARGQVMMAVSDLYQALKCDNISDKTLVSLHNNLREGVITSTRLLYDPLSLGCKVIQHYNSAIIRPSVRELIISPLDEEPINSAKSCSKILACLQAYLDTDDGPDEIFSNLAKLKYKMDISKLEWIPEVEFRGRLPERAAVLCSSGNGGLIFSYGNRSDANGGVSYAVRYSP